MYKPLVEMVPFCVVPPVTLLTCHVTPVSLEPVTVAWNCCVPAEATVADMGEIAIDTTGGGGGGEPEPELELELPPPQAVANKRRVDVARKVTADQEGRSMEGLTTKVADTGVDEQQLRRVA